LVRLILPRLATKYKKLTISSSEDGAENYGAADSGFALRVMVPLRDFGGPLCDLTELSGDRIHKTPYFSLRMGLSILG